MGGLGNQEMVYVGTNVSFCQKKLTLIHEAVKYVCAHAGIMYV